VITDSEIAPDSQIAETARPNLRSGLMDQPFSTRVVRADGATVIYVQGEIDMNTAGRLRDALEPHMGPEQTIVLDLSGVDFMDSACLTVLVQARGTLTADGGSLILRNPSRAAHRVLTTTGMEFILAQDADEHPQAD
jgi:anti-sigma B factor antagonist